MDEKKRSRMDLPIGNGDATCRLSCCQIVVEVVVAFGRNRSVGLSSLSPSRQEGRRAGDAKDASVSGQVKKASGLSGVAQVRSEQDIGCLKGTV